MTKIVKTSDSNPFTEISKCAFSGGVFIYPTETLYGIGCLASNENGCKKILEIKNRAENKGLIILVKDAKMLNDNFLIEKELLIRYSKLNKPLTLILRCKKLFPKIVSGRTNKIAVRISSNNFIKELFNHINEPITSTSANISGGGNLLTFTDIYKQFKNKVDLIVNSGNLPPSKGSSILDLTEEPPVIIREGDLTKKEIEEFLNG